MDRSELIDCPKCQRPTESVVVMACDHHLCLECAASVFVMKKSSDRTRFHIDCEFCHNTTLVEQSTVNCLVDYLQDITRAGVSHKKPKPKNRLGNSSKQSQRSVPPSITSKDRLLCLDCQHALNDVDQYLKGEHKLHNVQNVKSIEPLVPMLAEIKAMMQERITALTSKTKEEESLLAFLTEKKEIERARIQMTFGKLRKMLDQRELTAYRFLEQVFAEQSQLLERSLTTSNEQIFQLDMKFNELGDILKDKTLAETFNFIRNNKASLMKSCKNPSSLDQSRMNVLQKQLDGNITSFEAFIKDFDKYKEDMPVCCQPISQLNTAREQNPNTRKPSSHFEQSPSQEFKNILNMKSNVPLASPTLLKQTRSSSSLGPSLLKVEQSTPIQGLIRALQKKIHRNTLKLSANLGSPRNTPNLYTSIKPVDRIRRLFSPS